MNRRINWVELTLLTTAVRPFHYSPQAVGLKKQFELVWRSHHWSVSNLTAFGCQFTNVWSPYLAKFSARHGSTVATADNRSSRLLQCLNFKANFTCWFWQWMVKHLLSQEGNSPKLIIQLQCITSWHQADSIICCRVIRVETQRRVRGESQHNASHSGVTSFLVSDACIKWNGQLANVDKPKNRNYFPLVGYGLVTLIFVCSGPRIITHNDRQHLTWVTRTLGNVLQGFLFI